MKKEREVNLLLYYLYNSKRKYSMEEIIKIIKKNQLLIGLNDESIKNGLKVVK